MLSKGLFLVRYYWERSKHLKYNLVKKRCGKCCVVGGIHRMTHFCVFSLFFFLYAIGVPFTVRSSSHGMCASYVSYSCWVGELLFSWLLQTDNQRDPSGILTGHFPVRVNQSLQYDVDGFITRGAHQRKRLIEYVFIHQRIPYGNFTIILVENMSYKLTGPSRNPKQNEKNETSAFIGERISNQWN